MTGFWWFLVKVKYHVILEISLFAGVILHRLVRLVKPFVLLLEDHFEIQAVQEQ